MTPRLAWTLAALASAWAFPNLAYACSCTRPPPPLAAAEAAHAVFEGRATAGVTEGMRIRTTFEVLRTFKGELGARVDILTMSSSATCGRRYADGQSYLVYASESEYGLSDNLCSRTRRTVDAGTDFAVLGKGLQPGGIPEPQDEGADLEPPRITAPPQMPPEVQPRARGCAVSRSALPHASLLVLLLLGRRRRPADPC